VKILFDQGTPVPLVKCRTSLYQGWSAKVYQRTPARVYQAG
jgi:hypothetical protein